MENLAGGKLGGFEKVDEEGHVARRIFRKRKLSLRSRFTRTKSTTARRLSAAVHRRRSASSTRNAIWGARAERACCEAPPSKSPCLPTRRCADSASIHPRPCPGLILSTEAPAMGSEDTKVSEKSKVALHYGNMRFAMFTVFTAVVGAALAFPFSDGGRAFFGLYPTLRGPYGVCALIVSVLFTLAEMRISQLVSFYQSKAFNDKDFPKPDGHGLWSVVVMLTMIAPYVMSALFWVAFTFGDLSLPASVGKG
jgi:hypothetical protein